MVEQDDRRGRWARWREVELGSSHALGRDGVPIERLGRLRGEKRAAFEEMLLLGLELGDPHAADALAFLGAKAAIPGIEAQMESSESLDRRLTFARSLEPLLESEEERAELQAKLRALISGAEGDFDKLKLGRLLCRLGDVEGGLPLLDELLRGGEHHWNRQQAAWILQEIDDDRAASVALRVVREDPSSYVRISAANSALALAGTKSPDIGRLAKGRMLRGNHGEAPTDEERAAFGEVAEWLKKKLIKAGRRIE